jgi:heme-degrading monooxygenase HmoA
MITFIVTVTAKTGHEPQVAEFYQSLGDALEAAPGFTDRKIYQAKSGTMLAAVRAGMTEEQRAKLDEAGHKDVGTRFVLIEFWDSVDDRMAFAQGASAKRMTELIPHLLPEHTHEFYEELL